MFLVGTLLSLITNDQDTKVKWEVRAEVAWTMVLSTADPVLDVIVLIDWYYYSHHGHPGLGEYGDGGLKEFIFYDLRVAQQVYGPSLYIGIGFLVLSVIASTLNYYFTADFVTVPGFCLHLLGFGCVYDGMQLLIDPVLPPWKCIVGTEEKRWSRFSHSKAIESIVEALPFTILQCFALI